MNVAEGERVGGTSQPIQVSASHNLRHGEAFLLVQSSVGGRGGEWG